MYQPTHENDYRKIEAGRCKARAASASYKHIISKKGEELEFVCVVFKLENGELLEWPAWFGDDDEKNARSVKSLTICGWEGSDPRDMTGIDRNEVQLEIEDKTRLGKHGETIVESRVKWVNEKKIEKTEGPPEPAKIAKLANRIRVLRGGSPEFDPSDDVPF